MSATLCAILFTSYSCTQNPEKEGSKLAQQACDCQKEYAQTLDIIYQEFLVKFDSYGFKNRTEAREKWKDIKENAAQQLEACMAEVQQRVKEARSKFPTNAEEILDPKFLEQAVRDPKGYAQALAKQQQQFAKNQEIARKFDEAYRHVTNQCLAQKTEIDETALEQKILTVIPQKPNVEKLKQDLVRRRITEQSNGYYGRGWAWQINSIDELKSVNIVSDAKVGEDYVLEVHLLLQKDAAQYEADLQITCVLGKNDDWTIDFIETKDIHIVKTERYNNCVTKEVKRGWGTSLQFTNSCDVNLIVGGQILGNSNEWTKFSCQINANSTGSVAYNGKEYRIDFIERQ